MGNDCKNQTALAYKSPGAGTNIACGRMIAWDFEKILYLMMKYDAGPSEILAMMKKGKFTKSEMKFAEMLSKEMDNIKKNKAAIPALTVKPPAVKAKVATPKKVASKSTVIKAKTKIMGKRKNSR